MLLHTARASTPTHVTRDGSRRLTTRLRHWLAFALCIGAMQGVQAETERTPAVKSSMSPGWNLETLQNLNEAKAHGLRVMGLEHAWQLAQENDAEYRQTLAELRAAQTQRRQGRSNLLPQVQAGYYRGVIRGTRKILDTPMPQPNATLDYDSETAYVQLQQPLLNYSRYAEYQRGNALAESGEARFEQQRQERFVALAEAYFGVLLAQERLWLDEALEESLSKQAAAQESLYQQDEATRIDAQEVQARLALAKADVISSRDALRTARRELQAFLGVDPEWMAGLADTFAPEPPQPANLAAWLENGRALNAEVRVAKAEMQVADANVERARSRHLPQLDLVANWTKADSENLSTLSQNTNTFSVGMSLSIPIFAGGYNTAAQARARAEQRQAGQELQATIEKTQADIVRHYTAVTGSLQRIAALVASEASSELSLEAAQQGYRYGVITNIDVLKRQETLYKTRHELIKSRFDYLLSLIRLWVAAGVFDDMRVREFDTRYISSY